jgi:hypothetical protein
MLSVYKLSADMLSFILPNVIRSNVVMLSVVAPFSAADRCSIVIKKSTHLQTHFTKKSGKGFQKTIPTKKLHSNLWKNAKKVLKS